LTLGTHPGGWALGPFTSPRKPPPRAIVSSTGRESAAI
jgi:hypothetical protein